jgi:hypothetical protein
VAVVIAVRFPDAAALVAAMVALFHDEFPSVLCRFAGYEEPMRPRKSDRKKSGRRMVLQGRPLRERRAGQGSIAEALELFIEQRGAVVRVALGTPELAWLRASARVAEQVRDRPPAPPPDPPPLASAVVPGGAVRPKIVGGLCSEPPPPQ